MTILDLPDPRGFSEDRPKDPARRLARLEGSRIVLVDNGKLSPPYHSLTTIRQSLFEFFETSTWISFSRDFLRYHHAQLDPVIDEIVALSPDAAVVALADAGVAVQTVLVAASLEMRGIPTVVVATALGEPVCKAIAKPRMPALPIVLLDVVRADPPAKIQSLVNAVRPAIEAALTQNDARSAPESFDSGPLSFAPRSKGWSSVHEFQDWLARNDLGDGLPLLPPVPEIVDALLAAVAFDADEIIYQQAVTSGRSFRVRDAAVNAAMTGCVPNAFPVVVAALRAAAQPDFRLSQAAITTHPSGYCVILSGSGLERFGLSGGPGCLGPGHRGNLSVGRAVSLSIMHLFGARPGGADLTVFGSPAEIAYCMAENVGDLPWRTLAEERGFEVPAVLVVKAEGPRNAVEHLELTPTTICNAIVSAAMSLSANNAYVPGDLIVMINPEHAKVLTDAGWSRADLALAIHHRACLPRQSLEGRGMQPIRPSYMEALAEVPVTRSPEDVHIVVGGGPGPHSLVALPWGYSRGQWMPVSAR